MPIVKENMYFIALKGNLEEDNTYKKALNILKSSIVLIESFKLPYENSNRTIYKIKKIGKIEKKYPRNNQKIKNNPL